MTLLDVIYCSVMISFFAIIAISFFYEKHLKIGAMPSLPSVGKKAFALIPQDYKNDGQYKIMDLGSGWGGVLLGLSKLFPNSKIIGYELSPCPFIVSWVRTFFSKDINVSRKNFFEKDISSANIIFCYLSPYHMEQLKEKFSSLPDGTCIISCAFPITGWKIDKEEHIYNFFIKTPMYRYIMGQQFA